MPTKLTSIVKGFIYVGISAALLGCKPSVDVSEGPVIPQFKVRAGYTTVKVYSNGCVASLWADTSRSTNTPERIMKSAEMHISGEVKPSQINTDLMAAVVRNQADAVSNLIQAGADIEETNEAGCTALIWAAALKRNDILGLLLEAGASASSADAKGRTPLMFAAKAANLIAIEKLLNEGADVSASETDGIGEKGQTVLHHAVTVADNADVLRLLIEAGAVVDAIDERGQTPLINGSFFGSLENIKLLVEAGADVHHTMKNGKTAKDNAMINRAETIQYLESLD